MSYAATEWLHGNQEAPKPQVGPGNSNRVRSDGPKFTYKFLVDVMDKSHGRQAKELGLGVRLLYLEEIQSSCGNLWLVGGQQGLVGCLGHLSG